MKFLLTALLLGSSVAAFGQQVGTLSDVRGPVSLSASGVVTMVQSKSTTLADGDVVLNSGTGFSTVNLGERCIVLLTPNQFLTIDSKLTCEALKASVKTVGVAVAGGAPAVSPYLVAGGVVGGAIIIRNATKSKASGS